ncbi:MAG: hypothetical protein ACFCU1_09180 [Sumerlaeia bacterium]
MNNYKDIKIKCTHCDLGIVSITLDAISISTCDQCGLLYDNSQIINILPKKIEDIIIKNDEKNGWEFLANQEGIPNNENLPYDTNNPYYEQAAEELKFITKIISSKKLLGLDIVGSIGWGAYQLSKEGNSMVLAD